MQNISTTAELKEAIIQLEFKRDNQGKQLKEQFHTTYKSFNTINLLLKGIIEIATSPGLLSGLVSTIIDLKHRRSHLSQESEVHTSSIKGILHSLISTSLSKLIYDNSDTLFLFGQYFIRRLFHKKEKKEKEDQ